MPDTSYAFADPRAQTLWAKKLFEFALPNHVFQSLMGDSSNDFIHLDKDLLQKVGGTIIFKARERLSGGGVGDDGDTRNNAQQIRRRNMSLTVHTRATRTQSAGMQSEQLTDSKFRPDSKMELGDWIKEIIEDDVVTACAGLYNENSGGGAIQTINESYPTSSRIYYGGQNAAGTISNSGASFGTDAALTADTTANNLMGMKLMEAIKRRALAATPRFQGSSVPDMSEMSEKDIRTGVDGPVEGIYYLCLVHPLQVKAIRAETGTQGWREITAAAQVRGNKNPIFAGAAFIWDKMIFWEYDRVPRRTGAGGTTLAEGFSLNAGRTATDDACASTRTVCRAMLLGADALAFGWAMMPGWFEWFEDANKPVVKTEMIYAVERMNFNAHGTSTPGQDNAIYCVDTEVIADG